MDLKTSNYLKTPASSFFHFPDSMGRKDGAPSVQGRPGFSFTFGSRKNPPSKWDDAEKWLINSPANFMVKQCSINGSVIKHKDNHHRGTEGAADEQEPKIVSFLDADKLTKEEEGIFPKFKCLGAIQEVKNKDTGTEMTPVQSRYPTPVKSLSPPRHNTPESRLGLMDDQIGCQLECDLANKVQPWTPFDSNWKSMEDEDDDEISKSLRQFGFYNEFLDTISGPRPSAWEEQQMSEPCLRYQMKEAKIQAWVNLQKAKAEAQTRKLEVKIQKMRSKYEEKLMKKMTIVGRKAEELRAAARLDHCETVVKSNKTPNHHHPSCGCLISKTLIRHS